MMGAACVCLVALMVQSSVAAQDSPLVATVANPAVVTAAAAPVADQGVASQPSRVIISVTAFRPPRDGAVQAVVKVQRDGGTEQEIGRFGIFPNAEFKAAGPSKAQRFGLPLPKELTSGGAVKLHVYLVPFKGEGSGARLEIGGAEIR
ncbi:MAG: hypothetical protein ACRECN_01100 [Methylocella sp.]